MSFAIGKDVQVVTDIYYMAVHMVGDEQAFVRLLFYQPFLYLLYLYGCKMRERLVEHGKAGPRFNNGIKLHKPALAPGEGADAGMVAGGIFRKVVLKKVVPKAKVTKDPLEGKPPGDEMELRQVYEQVGTFESLLVRHLIEAHRLFAIQGAVDNFHQARLALAVAAQKAGDPAGLAFQVDIGQDPSPVKLQLDAIGFELVDHLYL